MGMLYEYDEAEPFNERERRALASEGRQGVSETLRTPYTARTESGGPEGPWLIEGPGLHEPWIVPYIGEAAELGRLMNHAYRAALEWAAGQVESVGCDCGGVPHADSCPVELAAKIREGAP